MTKSATVPARLTHHTSVPRQGDVNRDQQQRMVPEKLAGGTEGGGEEGLELHGDVRTFTPNRSCQVSQKEAIATGIETLIRDACIAFVASTKYE